MIKLGIDVHAKDYVVVRQVDEAVSQPAQRFNLEGLLGFVRRQVAVAQSVQGRVSPSAFRGRDACPTRPGTTMGHS